MPEPALPRLHVPVGEPDHVRGPATSPVTLVEYGDYQCPFCGRAHPVVKALIAQLGNRMRFCFRHFPLTTIHPLAQQAAEAAEAAGAQGRFWEMHDLLFEHQDGLGGGFLVQYATDLGLDRDRFQRELASHAHADRVREHFMSGVRSGVNGTPTFFLNDVRYDGPHEQGAMLEAVEGALSASASRR
jgi:protein-disulfide isomerase